MGRKNNTKHGNHTRAGGRATTADPVSTQGGPGSPVGTQGGAASTQGGLRQTSSHDINAQVEYILRKHSDHSQRDSSEDSQKQTVGFSILHPKTMWKKRSHTHRKNKHKQLDLFSGSGTQAVASHHSGTSVRSPHLTASHHSGTSVRSSHRTASSLSSTLTSSEDVESATQCWQRVTAVSCFLLLFIASVFVAMIFMLGNPCKCSL